MHKLKWIYHDVHGLRCDWRKCLGTLPLNSVSPFPLRISVLLESSHIRTASDIMCRNNNYYDCHMSKYMVHAVKYLWHFPYFFFAVVSISVCSLAAIHTISSDMLSFIHMHVYYYPCWLPQMMCAPMITFKVILLTKKTRYVEWWRKVWITRWTDAHHTLYIKHGPRIEHPWARTTLKFNLRMVRCYFLPSARKIRLVIPWDAFPRSHCL